MSGYQVQVVLPGHLRSLIGLSHGAVSVAVSEPTLAAVLAALETEYPVLRGTIRDHDGHRRRPLVRFFACEQDLSHQALHESLPDAVLGGREPLLIVGAMAGG